MPDQAGEVNFFGVKIKVKSPTLASLLNSDVTDDVVVVARRAFKESRRDEVEIDDVDGAAPGGAEETGRDPGENPASRDRVNPLPPDWLDLRLARDRAAWERGAAAGQAGVEPGDDPLAGLCATSDVTPGSERGA